MSAPGPISSAALAASAGTGKTFALTSRYLALLAVGVDPASIVALTFTRKAAGEILARILTRLATAARTPENLADLNQQLAEAGLPGFTSPGDARSALRALARELPRLRIGTLDSFFFQILRQFRLELGIGADPAISEEQDNAMEDLVLQRLLDRTALPESEEEELLEAFKNATFGEERKSAYASIQRLIQNQYELSQRAPDPDAWGNPMRIWPDGASLLQPLPPPDWPALLAALDAHPPAAGDARVAQGWSKFVDLLRRVAGGGDFDFKNTLGAQFYAALAAPGATCESFTYYRKEIPIPPDAQAALASALAFIRRDILLRRIVRTRGLRHLLSAYGREHRAHVAASGRLTFNDIAQLLSPAAGLVPNDLRLRLDARLDVRFLHWLLDEFQDTSLVQWSVIENLLDEVIQNPDGDRSLFYVGDTKQAIYEWRSGDPRLFRRIRDKYSPAIAEAPPLIRSWRSSRVVLDAVNQVFGSLAGLPLPKAEHLPEDWPTIAARWTAEWKPHEAAAKNADLPGHVALHVLPRPGPDEEGMAAADRAAAIVRDLRETIPGFHRLSVALLARGNEDGLELIEALARLGISAVWSGSSPLLDNALLPAILSFILLIEHPGDTSAREHVAMSPLAPLLSSPAPRSPLPAFARLTREQGYAGFCARLAAALDLSNAPLEQQRLRTLITLAAHFDRQPDPTALRFLAFVQNQSVPAEESGSNIQILTMHKAKGLEFDIVLLPALGSQGITARAKSDVLVRERDTHQPVPPIDWILSSPETKAIEAEPPLAAQLAANRQGKALEELRLLYVAMTRAKRALHLVVTAPPKDWKTLRLDDVVRLSLAPDAQPDADHPVCELGNPDWWQSAPLPAPGSSLPAPSPPPLPSAPAEPPIEAHIASQDHAGAPGHDGRHFRPEGTAARELGTRIHELFEQIEWLAPGEIPDFPDAPPDHIRLLAAFLEDPELHRLFERPRGTVELLREQAFEAILPDGRWLSGKIDRLHVARDSDGTPLCAHVFDFKTDQLPDPERHRPQMDDYRQSVARLFSLSPSRVACSLLFLRSRQAVDL